MLNGLLYVYASHDIRRPEAKEESVDQTANNSLYFGMQGRLPSSPLLVLIATVAM